MHPLYAVRREDGSEKSACRIVREWACRWERRGEEGSVEVCWGESVGWCVSKWMGDREGNKVGGFSGARGMRREVRETYTNYKLLWINEFMLEDSVEDCAAQLSSGTC